MSSLKFCECVGGVFLVLCVVPTWAVVSARLAVASEHVLVVKGNGDLWGWGDDQLGQVGAGFLSVEQAPGQVGNGFKKVYATDTESLALKDDGALWAWGANENGRLGDGSTRDAPLPVKIGDGFAADFTAWSGEQ